MDAFSLEELKKRNLAQPVNSLGEPVQGVIDANQQQDYVLAPWANQQQSQPQPQEESGFWQGLGAGAGGVVTGLGRLGQIAFNTDGKTIDQAEQYLQDKTGRSREWTVSDMWNDPYGYLSRASGLRYGAGNLVGSMIAMTGLGAAAGAALPESVAVGTAGMLANVAGRVYKLTGGRIGMPLEAAKEFMQTPAGKALVAEYMGRIIESGSEGGSAGAEKLQETGDINEARKTAAIDSVINMGILTGSGALNAANVAGMIGNKEKGKLARYITGELLEGAQQGFEEGSQQTASEYAQGKAELGNFLPWNWSDSAKDQAAETTIVSPLFGGARTVGGKLANSLMGKQQQDTDDVGQEQQSEQTQVQQEQNEPQNYRPAIISEDIEDTNLQNTVPEAVNGVNALNTWAYNNFGKDIVVSGGWRSEENNRAVNGHPNSHHLYGQAVDMDLSNFTDEEREAIEAQAKAMGFRTLYHDAGTGVHLHVAVDDGTTLDLGGMNYTGPTGPVGISNETDYVDDYLSMLENADNGVVNPLDTLNALNNEEPEAKMFRELLENSGESNSEEELTSPELERLQNELRIAELEEQGSEFATIGPKLEKQEKLKKQIAAEKARLARNGGQRTTYPKAINKSRFADRSTPEQKVAKATAEVAKKTANDFAVDRALDALQAENDAQMRANRRTDFATSPFMPSTYDTNPRGTAGFRNLAEAEREATGRVNTATLSPKELARTQDIADNTRGKLKVRDMINRIRGERAAAKQEALDYEWMAAEHERNTKGVANAEDVRNNPAPNVQKAAQSRAMQDVTQRAMAGDHGAQRTFDRMGKAVKAYLMQREIDRLTNENDFQSQLASTPDRATEPFIPAAYEKLRKEGRGKEYEKLHKDYLKKNFTEGYSSESGRPLMKSDANEFVVRPNGSTLFGTISEEVANATNGLLTPGEIKLKVGDKHEGLIHAKDHNSEAIDAGYSGIEDLMADVAENFDEIYERKPKPDEQNKKSTFVLVKRSNKNAGSKNKVMPIYFELSQDDDGNYYLIVTAIPKDNDSFLREITNEKPGKKETLIYSSQRTSAATSSDTGSVSDALGSKVGTEDASGVLSEKSNVSESSISQTEQIDNKTKGKEVGEKGENNENESKNEQPQVNETRENNNENSEPEQVESNQGQANEGGENQVDLNDRDSIIQYLEKLENEDLPIIEIDADTLRQTNHMTPKEMLEKAVEYVKGQLGKTLVDPLGENVYFEPGSTENVETYALHMIAGMDKPVEASRRARLLGLLVADKTVQNPLAIIHQSPRNENNSSVPVTGQARKVYLALYKGKNTFSNSLIVGVEEGQEGRIVTSMVVADKNGNKKSALKALKNAIKDAVDVVYIWEGQSGHSRPSPDQTNSTVNANLIGSGNSILSQETEKSNNAQKQESAEKGIKNNIAEPTNEQTKTNQVTEPEFKWNKGTFVNDKVRFGKITMPDGSTQNVSVRMNANGNDIGSTYNVVVSDSKNNIVFMDLETKDVSKTIRDYTENVKAPKVVSKEEYKKEYSLTKPVKSIPNNGGTLTPGKFSSDKGNKVIDMGDGTKAFTNAQMIALNFNDKKYSKLVTTKNDFASLNDNSVARIISPIETKFDQGVLKQYELLPVMIDDGEYNSVILKNGNSFVRAQAPYVQYFVKEYGNDITFHGDGSSMPILVMNNGKTVGIISPLRSTVDWGARLERFAQDGCPAVEGTTKETATKQTEVPTTSNETDKAVWDYYQKNIGYEKDKVYKDNVVKDGNDKVIEGRKAYHFFTEAKNFKGAIGKFVKAQPDMAWLKEAFNEVYTGNEETISYTGGGEGYDGTFTIQSEHTGYIPKGHYLINVDTDPIYKQSETYTDAEENAQNEPANTREQNDYKYYMNERGASPGAVPDGFTRIDDNDKGGRYGAIYYSKPLTKNEIAAYELTPDSNNAKQEAIQDFGNKIGGARKDKVYLTDPFKPKAEKKKAKTDNEKELPEWRKPFNVYKDDLMGGVEKPYQVRFKQRPGSKMPWAYRALVSNGYATEQEAETAIKAAVYMQNFTIGQSGSADNPNFTIEKRIGAANVRKYFPIKDGFKTREEAQKYAVQHIDEILATKTYYGEADLATPLIKSWQDARTGDAKDRLKGKNATAQMFADEFGFYGVQFGNWNNQQERQEVMNAAYEGLHDLAEALGLPPKIISLNGNLGLAFGARGQGLSGAKAHFEPMHLVINLTKMKGAGSLAHEWMHAVDQFLLIKGGIITLNRDAEGKLLDKNALSKASELGYNFGRAKLNKELSDSFKNLMNSMLYKDETFTKDQNLIDKRINHNKEALDQELNKLRKYVAEERRYGSRKAPATAEQLKEFDELATKIAQSEEEPKYDFGVERYTTPDIEALGVLVKKITGRGFAKDNDTAATLVHRIRMGRTLAREKQNAIEQSEGVRQVPTDYKAANMTIDSGRATDYWTKPTEMLSRAFSAFIEDELKDKGYTSDFMSYGSDNRLYLFGKPFPEGKERERINENFKAFFKEVAKEVERNQKETGEIKFSIKPEEWGPKAEHPVGERTYGEVLEETLQAFPNAKVETKNGALVLSLPDGSKFQVSIKDNIILNAKQQKKAKQSHGVTSGRVQGYWKKLTQNGVSRILAVSKSSERGTAFHEAMHAAIDLALTAKEREALFNYYRKIAEKQGKDVEEVIADAYRDWVLARQKGQGTTFGKLWQKIKDFCTKIKALFDKGAEVQSIFQDVESGKVYERNTRGAGVAKGKADIWDNESELKKVREKYEGTDQWMKAPNGKPTNLTEQQWLQVRTPAFKKWFGDWENNPEKASKILDDNGEPLAVYHGTPTAEFEEFNDGVTYTTADKDVAKYYSEHNTNIVSKRDSYIDLNIDKKPLKDVVRFIEKHSGEKYQEYKPDVVELVKNVFGKTEDDLADFFGEETDNSMNSREEWLKDHSGDTLEDWQRTLYNAVEEYHNLAQKAVSGYITKSEAERMVDLESQVKEIRKEQKTLAKRFLRGAEIGDIIKKNPVLRSDEKMYVSQENDSVPYSESELREQAGELARQKSAKGLFPLFANIKNPFIYESKGKDWKRLSLVEYTHDEADDDVTTDDIAKWARKQGYDGVIFKNVFDSDEHAADEFVTFKPNQLKSSTENNGNFSEDNDNIYYSVAKAESKRTVTRQELQKAVENIVPLKVEKDYRSDAYRMYNRKANVGFVHAQGSLNELNSILGMYVDTQKKLSDNSDLRDELLKNAWDYQQEQKKARRFANAEVAEQVKEGAAYFGRLYATDKDQAKALFPKYFAAFERAVNADKALKAKVNSYLETAEAFYKQTPEGRAKAGLTQLEKEPTTWKEKVKTYAKQAYVDWFDDKDVLRRVEREIETITGKKIKTDESAYMQARVSNSSAASRVDMVVNGAKTKWGKAAAKNSPERKAWYKALNSVYGGAWKYDVCYQDVVDKATSVDEKYLKKGNFKDGMEALGSYLLANRFLEIWETKPNYKASMSKETAAKVVADAPKAIKEAADLYYKFDDNLIAVMNKEGMLSDEGLKGMRKYTRYCPLFRDFADEAAFDKFMSRMSSPNSYINLSNGIKALTEEGSDRTVLDDPTKSMLRMTASILGKVEKNKVGQKFIALSERSNVGQFVIPAIDPKTGKQLDTSNPQFSRFTVWENGEKKAYVTLPEVYDVLENATHASAYAALLDNMIARGASSTLRKGATISMGFMIRNFIRDTIGATINSKNGFIPLKDSFRGMNLLLNDAEFRNQYLASGANMAGYFKQDAESLDNMLNEMAGNGWWQKSSMLDKLHVMWEHYEQIGELIEQGTRAGEFKKALEKNKSLLEAAIDAKEVTLDFSRAGAKGRQFNRIIPFFNAVLQGGDKMVRTAVENPQKTMAMCASLSLATMLLWAINHDDDWYKELDNESKYSNWHFHVGDKHIKIPKPQEFGMLSCASVEAVLEQMFEKNPKAMSDWAAQFVETMTPSLLPALYRPILEVCANYDYHFQSAIVGKKYQNLKPEAQVNSNTSEFARIAGGMAGYSPIKIDHLIRGYFGGAGAFVARIPNKVLADGKQPAKYWNEMPVINEFIENDFAHSKSVNNFYELMDAANKQHTTYGKKGQPSADVVNIRKYGTIISGLRKDIQKITANKVISPERKRQLIENKTQRINQVAKRAVEKYGDKYL